MDVGLAGQVAAAGVDEVHGATAQVVDLATQVFEGELLDVDDPIAAPPRGQGQDFQDLGMVGEEIGMMAQVVRHLVAGHLGPFGRRPVLCRRVILFGGHSVLFPQSQSHATC